MTEPQVQYITRSMNHMEKAISTIIISIIISLLSWLAVSVSNQQIQQASFSTTQAAQTITLTKIQHSIDEAIPARNALFTENALLNQRVNANKAEIAENKAEIAIFHQKIQSLEASRK